MLSAALLTGLLLQLAQNPSPMTEQTRAHDRLSPKTVNGIRRGRALHIGHPGPTSPVIVHFHGEGWIPEQSAAKVYSDVTVVGIQLGGSSLSYQEAYKTPEALQALLVEIGASNRPLILSAFSAGYGAVRAILRHSYARIHGVLLMDGLHTDYVDREADAAALDVFLQFARDASQGKKRMLVTHSEVFPGTFTSTTETTDWLLRQLQLHRAPVLRWGPGGMQQLSEVRRGRLIILGFAGNSAPDHVDHFHGMATWLRAMRRM